MALGKPASTRRPPELALRMQQETETLGTIAVFETSAARKD
jgi:hypothetical protein